MNGQVVVVTGGGAGVGRGIALAFGSAGAHVVVAEVDRASGEAVVGELRTRGCVAELAVCDVTRRADVDAAVSGVVERFGRLDALVHNATSSRSSERAGVDDADPALWHEHAAVSVRGLFHCIQAAHAHLAGTQGALLVLSSPAGIQGSDRSLLYAAVKGAQRGIVKSLAKEWGPAGIRVNALAPLAVTPAMERAFAGDAGMRDRLTSLVPLGRLGDAETDIGPAAVFLCGDGARYVTGQTLVVSGGRLTSL